MTAPFPRILFLTPLFFLFAIATIATEPTHAQTGTGTTVTVHVRNATQILYEGNVVLPNAPVSVQDNQSVVRSVSGTSALAAIILADGLSTSFNITDLIYYPSFGSHYINCIQAGTNKCGQWQYVVNGTYPFVGIDQLNLSPGDDVYLYFGQPARLTPSNPMVETGAAFTVQAEKYEYQTNSYSPRTGVTVGVTQDNPADPFTPIVLSTVAVDGTGKATLSISSAGTYKLGIREDFYYPTVDVQAVQAGSGGGGSSVTTSSAAKASPAPSATPRPIGGLPDEGLAKRDPKADFLLKGQKNGGEIENALVSDWAAIALGGMEGMDAEKRKLKDYIIAHPETVIYTTDLERRAMALMALGVDPFTGTGKNYIVAIVRSFSNGQFGAEDLINDDVFALIPIVRAGIVKTSYRVKKAVDTLLEKQSPDGSWENPDLTAATIQALLLADNDTRIAEAVRRGREYLRKNQTTDGRIGMNSFSTAWASQALTGTGSTLEDRTASEKARKYVASKVQPDGGISDGKDVAFNRLWSTAYALAAAEGKHWADLLQPFSPRKAE